jgi:hypothetical protein
MFGSLLYQSQAKQNGDWLLACMRNAVISTTNRAALHVVSLARQERRKFSFLWSLAGGTLLHQCGLALDCI